jgi:hypothetical protein
MTGMSDARAADTALSSMLAQQFPSIPLQSVVRCVWDAEAAAEYAGVAADDRADLVARLARAHLEELAPFYVDDPDAQHLA